MFLEFGHLFFARSVMTVLTAVNVNDVDEDQPWEPHSLKNDERAIY
jgi:hypothetical protein